MEKLNEEVINLIWINILSIAIIISLVILVLSLKSGLISVTNRKHLLIIYNPQKDILMKPRKSYTQRSLEQNLPHNCFMKVKTSSPKSLEN